MPEPLDLEAIKARTDALMPGKRWHWKGYGLVESSSGYQVCLYASEIAGRFIAHARTDVPALVAEVERLRLLVAEGTIAFQLTREYIGTELLPAIDGWSWWDWTQKAEAALGPIVDA